MRSFIPVLIEVCMQGGKSSTVDMEALLSTKLEQQCTDANGYDIEQQLANQRFVTKVRADLRCLSCFQPHPP